jgi:hypothetical protein
MRHKRKFMIAGIVVVAGICLSGWLLRCRFDGHMVAISVYESKEAGLRAAVPVLARKLCECPSSTQVYRIIWTSPDSDKGEGIDEHALLYDSRWKRLGYEYDIDSGIWGKAYIVDAEAIKAVAEKGGTLEDFSEYDRGEESVR